MKYLEWIKESKTYICPKSGIYKVICVGGGSSGGGKTDNKLISHNGNATSFGSLISADGGRCFDNGYGSSNDQGVIVGGQCGYDGINYGSTPFISSRDSSSNSILIGADSAKSFDNNIGHGYGAGGGSKYTYFSYKSSSGSNGSMAYVLATPGGCGKMESTIVDLTEGQSITCTVGKGGSNIFTEDEIRNLVQPSAPDIVVFPNGVDEVITMFSDAISSGADGVIIIQYLGSEM